MFSWVSFNLICSVPNLPHHILVFQCRSMKLNWEGLGWKVFTNNSNNIQTLFESCLSILKATFFLLNSWFWWGTYFPQYEPKEPSRFLIKFHYFLIFFQNTIYRMLYNLNDHIHQALYQKRYSFRNELHRFYYSWSAHSFDTENLSTQPIYLHTRSYKPGLPSGKSHLKK